MNTPRYTASVSPNKDGTAWVISFRHPLRKDPRGKQGLKIRRGLGVSNAVEAEQIKGQMNVLLSDPSWHSIAKRTEAEHRFSPVVVRAFYDNIQTQPTDSWAIRNEAIGLPGAEDGFARVLMVGPTGHGKTSLLRHLIGSHPVRDRFPSTSAARTTICDIEVVASQAPSYRAVVTFFNEWAIHTNVHECVASACTSLWDNVADDGLAERLLTHKDLRFRLGYVIGSWKQTLRAATEADDVSEEEDDWDYDGTDEKSDRDSDLSEADETLPTRAELTKMNETLASFLGVIRQLAETAKSRLRSELEIDLDQLTGSEKEAAQDLFEDIVQSLPGFDDLVNDIMDEIRERFKRLEQSTLRVRPGGWPESWHFESEDRDEFLRAVRRFSSNYAPSYGTLLTPLVDGMRIDGPLFPGFADRTPKLVLLDGEGIGHVGDAAAGISTRIARRFADVDVILLVDSAKAPMLDAPTSVLRAVAASGHQSKLAVAFTHFDLVRGQANLPTFDAQRAHVMSSVRQKLTELRDVVGVPAVRAIERHVDDRCYMLGYLDRSLTENNLGPVKELNRLIDLFEQAIEPKDEPKAIPIYDMAGLVLAIQAATANFHDRWDTILGFKRSGSVRTAHWAEVKALNRRVALNIDDGEYKDLRPVPDLIARLAEEITKFLDHPHAWKSTTPTEAEADAVLADVQQAVSSRLQGFADKRLLRVPARQWTKAFQFSGPGSTFERRTVINEIYDASAPVPGVPMDVRSTEFLSEVRRLVHEAVDEAGGEIAHAMSSAPAEVGEESAAHV